MSDRKLTQLQFKERCTAEMWEKYVEGLLLEAMDRDGYSVTDGGMLSFVPDVGGGCQSNPTLIWNATDKCWEEPPSWD